MTLMRTMVVTIILMTAIKMVMIFDDSDGGDNDFDDCD